MADDEYIVTATESRLQQLSDTIDYVASLVDAPLRRRHIQYPSGGGSSLRPYIITQTKTIEEETFPVAVFRDVNEDWERRYISQETRAQTFEAQRAIWDGTDEEFNFPPGDPVTVDIYTHLMTGVAFTGQRIVVSNVGGKLCCVGGSSGHLFIGETAEAIAADASGLVELTTMEGTRATVYALNDTNADLADEANITVEFHDGRQVFIISRRAC